ncbi:HECT-domain protein [Dictyocaulus viviparus]|uniref:HECT-type E3 ubiquitin transferase n=1 Tax=Dictyocaulus viviparus TaxID=29172 RepID=A0A0D8Y089_DICVI|nr:HECT-domain protein [Dictyocaulus viviparus]
MAIPSQHQLSALDQHIAPGLRLWMLIALVSGVLLIMVVLVCCFMRIRIPRTKRQIDLIAAKRKMRNKNVKIVVKLQALGRGCLSRRKFRNTVRWVLVLMKIDEKVLRIPSRSRIAVKLSAFTDVEKSGKVLLSNDEIFKLGRLLMNVKQIPDDNEGNRVSEIKIWQSFVHFLVIFSSSNGWLLVRNAPQSSLFVVLNEYKPLVSGQALNALFSVLLKLVKNEEALLSLFVSCVLTCPAIVIHLNTANLDNLLSSGLFGRSLTYLHASSDLVESIEPQKTINLLGNIIHLGYLDDVNYIKWCIDIAGFTVALSLEIWKKLAGGSPEASYCGDIEKETLPTLAAVVCQLYMAALSTMINLRHEIVAGICREDRILRQLWFYLVRWGSHGRYQPSSASPSPLNAALSLVSNPQSLHAAPLMLFADAAAIVISVLDESELYESSSPFTIEQLVNISRFCNTFCFRAIWTGLLDDKYSENGLFESIHQLCTILHVRDSRRTFVNDPKFWLAPDIKSSVLIGEFEKKTARGMLLMRRMSHLVSLKERMLLFRRFVNADKATVESSVTLITVCRNRLVEDGYRQLSMLSANALKSTIRVKFVNQQGLDEAGIDQDGVFKEFLELTIKHVFDPALNLFNSTAGGVLYPSASSSVHEDHLALFQFVGRMLAKAVYEGIVVDVQLAPVLLAAMLGSRRLCAFDELSQLDPELYRSLSFVKKYKDDVSNLSLTFSIDEDFMGKISTVDLIPGGRTIQVTNENKIDYVHRMAHHRVFSQTKEQCKAFVAGAQSVLNPAWLFLFAPYELQLIISGYASLLLFSEYQASVIIWNFLIIVIKALNVDLDISSLLYLLWRISAIVGKNSAVLTKFNGYGTLFLIYPFSTKTLLYEVDIYALLRTHRRVVFFDIDLVDLKKHVQYYGGFHGSHRLIKWLWEIVEKDFTPDERKLFLKDQGDTLGSVVRGFLALKKSHSPLRLPTGSKILL